MLKEKIKDKMKFYIMIVFFDIGQKGAISYFEKNQLIRVNNFDLDKMKSRSVKQKLLLFKEMLTKNFQEPVKVSDVGCYQPFGTNRKTIINLAMMCAVLILFFQKAKFHLIHEWVAWKAITKNNKIPTRLEKKAITVQWAKKQFQITKISDDAADAILGGCFLVDKLNNENKTTYQ